MSTINGFGAGAGAGVPLPDDAAPLPGTTTTSQAPAPAPSPAPVVQAPPLFSLSFAGPGTALLLGLAKPRGNFGDTEALFSQIAAALKTVQAEARDNDDFLRSSERMSQTARAGTALQQMLEINGQIVGHETNIRERGLRIEAIDVELAPLRTQKTELEGQVSQLQTQIAGIDGQISALTTQIGALDTQIQSLTTQINGLTGQINTLNQQIDQRNSQISTLNGQIAGWNSQIQTLQAQLAVTTDPAVRASLQTQINTLQGQVNTATTTRNTLVAERDGLVQQRDQRVSERSGLEATRTTLTADRDGKIAERTSLQGQRATLNTQLQTAQTELNGVNAQIDALEDEKKEAKASINRSERAIGGLIGEMTIIATGALIVGQTLLNLLRGDGMRDSFETRAYSDDFEAALAALLADVTRIIQDKADTEFTQENAQVGLGDWRFEQGVGIAGRFGAMQPAQTMAIGFASAMASVIGTLRTLLEQADSLPQNPVALAEAGIARMRMTL